MYKRATTIHHIIIIVLLICLLLVAVVLYRNIVVSKYVARMQIPINYLTNDYYVNSVKYSQYAVSNNWYNMTDRKLHLIESRAWVDAFDSLHDLVVYGYLDNNDSTLCHLRYIGGPPDGIIIIDKNEYLRLLNDNSDIAHNEPIIVGELMIAGVLNGNKLFINSKNYNCLQVSSVDTSMLYRIKDISSNTEGCWINMRINSTMPIQLISYKYFSRKHPDSNIYIYTNETLSVDERQSQPLRK